MKPTKLALVGATGAFASLALLGLASAQTPDGESSAEGTPRGPYVDFCPTREQVEEHLNEYGFDYKPTVACSSEGEVVVPREPRAASGSDRAADESNRAAMAREKAFLQSLEPGPDTDGDPGTIEGIGPEGQEVVIYVQTSRPQDFADVTPAEFAEEVYP